MAACVTGGPARGRFPATIRSIGADLSSIGGNVATKRRLTGLFVGSEGLLGIITEITLRLEPAPPAPETAAAYFADLPAAGRSILSILEAGLRPTVMEIIDRSALRIVEQSFPMDLDTGAACLLLMKSVPEAQPIEVLAEHCAEHGATFRAPRPRHPDDRSCRRRQPASACWCSTSGTG